jgi:hypothetical protein
MHLDPDTAALIAEVDAILCAALTLVAGLVILLPQRPGSHPGQRKVDAVQEPRPFGPDASHKSVAQQSNPVKPSRMPRGK